MNVRVIGYALLCVAVPLAWGLLVVLISNAIERKMRDGKKTDAFEDVPPIEYHI
jgi:hypothetical protein